MIISLILLIKSEKKYIYLPFELLQDHKVQDRVLVWLFVVWFHRVSWKRKLNHPDCHSHQKIASPRRYLFDLSRHKILKKNNLSKPFFKYFHRNVVLFSSNFKVCEIFQAGELMFIFISFENCAVLKWVTYFGKYGNQQRSQPQKLNK